MELRHLRYFVAVAEELHFGRAAARLRIAQPPLSQQIKALETEIGVRLLERTRRRVELTAAGRALLDEARRTLAQADRCADAARRAARGELGRLAIGFVGSTTYDLLPAVLREFRRRFPDVSLALQEATTSEQVQALVAGEIDVGFGRPPVTASGLVATTLRREPIVLAVSRKHPLASRHEVELGALAREPLILFSATPRPSWADYIIGLCRAAGFEPPIAQETIELQTGLSLVSAGMGVALVPSSASALRRPGVVYRPLAPPTPVTELVVLRRDEPPSAALANFLDVLARLPAPGTAPAADAGEPDEAT